MLAVVGHWCGEDGQFYTALLALPEIKGHTTVIQPSALFEVTEMYDISTKVGYIVSDNATTNDLAIFYLEEAIHRKYNKGFIPQERRIRCIGHVINLIVKRLLFGSDVAALESETVRDADVVVSAGAGDDPGDGGGDDDNNNPDNDSRDKRRSAMWRNRGAVGKLHNIVKFIRRTPQCRAGFMAVQLEELQQSQASMLRADNNTRWNSTQEMIVSTLGMRDAIDTYMCHSLGQRLVKNGKPSNRSRSTG